LERAEAALALATEQVLVHWAGYAMAIGGCALVKNGHTEEGFARLQTGIDALIGRCT
jgi:hypothetical protein